MSDQIKSASVKIAPADRRCRYWAKIVRADATLPKPSETEGANDIVGAYLKNGEPDKALADLNQAIALNPRYLKAYQTRAVIYQQMGKPAQAQADMKIVQQSQQGH